MSCKFLLSLIFMLAIGLVNSYGNFSPLSAVGLGMEVPSYNARELAMGHSGSAYVTKSGSSIYGLPKTAFNNRTTFQAMFESDIVYLEDNSNSNTINSSNLPFIGMNFQAGWLGNLGIIYHQKFLRDFSYTPSNALTESQVNTFEGGPYELVYSLARSVTPRFALGLSYNQMMGRDRIIKHVTFDEVNYLDLTDTVVTKWSGGYAALSGMYRHKRFNLSVYSSLPGEIEERKTEHAENRDPNADRVSTFDYPLTLALGFNYKQNRNTNYTLDVHTTGWSGVDKEGVNRSWHAGAGYEYQGRGGKYRPYYTNMAYRAGMAYDRMYVLEADVYRITSGLGFPLGRRGSQLDFVLELGQRGSLDVHNFREGFIKMTIGLTGAGIWGQTRRRR